ncbi:MAG TPA: T9SS type A sorting domain-containing protein [Fibrobacteraceae bacterium]|nr:T9SS type A sorting domain-containing protein [Fibrobacteraceae bacterium]
MKKTFIIGNRMQKKLQVLFFSLMAFSTAFAGFENCTFNFGRQWKSGASLSNLDHVAIWLGDNNDYNTYWEGEMIRTAKSNNVTPVIYAYVIAEYGKDNGLVDCDMGSPNHCTGGANMIRNHWSSIISRYSNYAQGIASDYGTDKAIIWLIEPDFVQYSVTGDAKSSWNQDGGGIPDANLAGKYFNEIVSTIKGKLPNAKIAVDISPWFNNDLATWYNLFDKSKIDYAFTSGGRTQGDNARIRGDNNNNVTWANVKSWLGKSIIADDGYGVGGGSNSDYQEWMNTSNLNARIADGVIGLTIQEPVDSYYTFAKSNASLNTCSGQSSSSVKSSSSSVPVSSSSVTPSSSSVKSSSSSIPVSSSSIIPSSSSVSSSSSSATPSSSSVSSSSSSVVESAEWTAENSNLSNEKVNGVSIGQGSDWGKTRTVSRTLATVNSGTAYTLSFEASVSRGGASMDVEVALNEYCSEPLHVSSSGDVAKYTCTFTASKTESVTLQFTVPGERWETLTITNLQLVGPSGDILPIRTIASLGQIQSSVLLRNGRTIHWSITPRTTLQVFDVNGNKISQTRGSFLDLSKLPAGLYIIRSNNGNHSEFKRVNNF